MELKMIRVLEYLLEYNRENYVEKFDDEFFSRFVIQYSKTELLEMLNLINWAMENPNFDFQSMMLSKNVSNTDFLAFLQFMDSPLSTAIEMKTKG